MTEPEDSATKGAAILMFVAIIIGGALAYFVISNTPKFDVSNIPDEERWNDLNNHAARNRFCQAQGYTEARITDAGNFGFEQDSAGSPYGYYILCKRSVPEKQTYDYSAYKKWLIQLEINNITR